MKDYTDKTLEVMAIGAIVLMIMAYWALTRAG